ncbi:MAG: hypothetical protein IRZ10_12115 [Thermoflavifilum sp.]|nr:hypothetical protein [Thermoflavifilum sp.]MCL6515145.1 hypothetical protein [Alicyclobacillus sp.]
MFHFHALTIVALCLLAFVLLRGDSSIRDWPRSARWRVAGGGLVILALLCLAEPAMWGWQALGVGMGLAAGWWAQHQAWWFRIRHAWWILCTVVVAARMGWDLGWSGNLRPWLDPWMAVLLYPILVYLAFQSVYEARVRAEAEMSAELEAVQSEMTDLKGAK